jgi:hypothetical protein
LRKEGQLISKTPGRRGAEIKVKESLPQHRRLMPVMLSTQEAEIRRS